MENEPERNPRVQFGMRSLLEIIAVIAFVMALFYAKSSNYGRYEMIFSPMTGNRGEIYVLDSKTGRLWHRQAKEGAGWLEAGSPLPDASK